MAEQMTELQLMMQERQNTGTAWTRNDDSEKNGYLVVKDLWDPEEHNGRKFDGNTALV